MNTFEIDELVIIVDTNKTWQRQDTKFLIGQRARIIEAVANHYQLELLDPVLDEQYRTLDGCAVNLNGEDLVSLQYVQNVL